MGRIINRVGGWKTQIAISFLVVCLSQQRVMAEEYRVCPQCEITAIQQALDLAPEGAIIRVSSGVYREPTLTIKKSVQLIGESQPILDGQGHQQIMVIYKAAMVVIKGFVFKDTGVSFTSELAGLRVIESSNCQVSENSFLNTTYGVYLERSKHCRIFNNRFVGQATDESSGGNGIHIWTGEQHEIAGNVITGHRDGIYLEFVKSSTLSENEVHRNLRYGLHFMFSNNTISRKNVFRDNGSGVAVMYSQDIVMEENQYLQNRGTASYGLLLKDIQSSQFFGNHFFDNTVGIYMEGSNRSVFKENLFKSEGYGLRIMGNCENNEFSHNNFLKNTFDVTTNSSMSWNVFTENYWSRYAGYDLDHDHIGDIPFRPVSLSSVVVESIDSSFYLIGSFLFTLLDFIEQALPELTPEPLKDDHPLMEPWALKGA